MLEPHHSRIIFGVPLRRVSKHELRSKALAVDVETCLHQLRCVHHHSDRTSEVEAVLPQRCTAFDAQLQTCAGSYLNKEHRSLERVLATTDIPTMTDSLLLHDGHAAEPDNCESVTFVEEVAVTYSVLTTLLREHTPGLSAISGTASASDACSEVLEVPLASPQTAHIALPAFPIRFTRGTSASSAPDRMSLVSNASFNASESEATEPKSPLADMDVAYVTAVMNLAAEWQGTYRHLLSCTSVAQKPDLTPHGNVSAKEARIARWCNFTRPTTNHRRQRPMRRSAGCAT